MDLQARAEPDVSALKRSVRTLRLIRQVGGVSPLLSDEPALRNHLIYSSVLSGQQAGGRRQYQKFQITNHND